MGFLERFRCESEEYLHTYKKEYESGAAIRKAFAGVPDEKKTADMLKQVQKAGEALKKEAEAKLKLAEDCERLGQDIAARVRRRRGARRSPPPRTPMAARRRTRPARLTTANDASAA